MRTVEWSPEAEDDLRRLPANHRAKIKALTEVFLSYVPPQGRNTTLALGEPWGSIEQLSIDEFRVLYDVYEVQSVVRAVLVFEKPGHMTTLDALKTWLGEAPFAARRRR